MLQNVIVSNWEYAHQGDLPEGFVFSAPSVAVNTDDDFERTTITLGFSGTAPYHTKSFSLNYSFSVPATNLVDICVSSDDSASVSACGKTANSTLHTDGHVISDWIEYPSGNIEIHGTYNNVGGPYELSVTITLIRSINGKKPGVNMNYSMTTKTIDGSHEINIVTITCSGNAPSGCFGFSHTENFTMPGGNYIGIKVESDDNAEVYAGSISANSTLHRGGASDSEWIENPLETIPITATLINVGGPFSLTTSITTKKALVEMCFCAEKISAKEYDEQQTLPQQYEESRRINRTVFGCGEKVLLTFRDVRTKKELDLSIIAEISGDVLFSEGKYYLNTHYTEKTSCSITVTLCDGFSIKRDFEVEIPTSEYGLELDDEGYDYVMNESNSLPDLSMYYRSLIKIFNVFAYPKTVSFSGLYVWEVGDFGQATNFLALLNPLELMHMPHDPLPLSDFNSIGDITSIGLTEEQHKMAVKFYENLSSEDQNVLPKQQVWDDELKEEITQVTIGELIWSCSIRWSFNNPGVDERSKEKCLADKKVKNSDLRFDGTLPLRVQKMSVLYNIYQSSENPGREKIGFSIEKKFSVKK